jgi:hypothetical protein
MSGNAHEWGRNAPASVSGLFDEYRNPFDWLAHHGHHQLRRPLLQPSNLIWGGTLTEDRDSDEWHDAPPMFG